MTSITQRVIQHARADGLTVLTRKDWGSTEGAVYKSRRARTKAGEWGPFLLRADTVVQHITVTPPNADFAASARLVERIGMERFGSGVSYNWLVDMFSGEIAAGQPLDSKGTHTVNDKGIPGYSHDQNLVARAIAVVGMPTTPLSKKAEAAITRLLYVMVAQGAITPGFDYVPHSLFAFKDCPCDNTRERMPTIRRNVNKAPRDRQERAMQEVPKDHPAHPDSD